jgi:hypothetical protein
MARIVVIALLVVAVAIIGWTIGSAIARPTHRVAHDRPTAYASNAVWAEYYRRLAADARRSGNDASAADYDSLARTYETFDDPKEAE